MLHGVSSRLMDSLAPSPPHLQLAFRQSFPSEWTRWFNRRQAASDKGPSSELTGELIRTAKQARVEAVLFVSDTAVSARRLAQLATLSDAVEAREIIGQLNAFYESDACPFRVEEIASGYRLLTLPEFAPWLDKLHHRQADMKLSPPALETLTIIAYQQPIIRADLEAIRGVHSAEMLKQLMERGLIRIAGEDDSLGRPFLYATTRKFLETYGLRSLNDLPMAEELRRQSSIPDPSTDAPELIDGQPGESEQEAESEDPIEAISEPTGSALDSLPDQDASRTDAGEEDAAA